MKIVLCGKIGSGKSTIAKRLAKELHLKHYSAGERMRAIAREKGLKIEAFVKERSNAIDKKIDAEVRTIGKKEDNFILDGHVAFHFIPDAIHIFINVSDEVGAARIFKHPRRGESPATSVKELIKRNKKRWEIDRRRYDKLYGVDVDDMKNYDLVVDTTKLDVKGALHEIKRALRTLQKK